MQNLSITARHVTRIYWISVTTTICLILITKDAMVEILDAERMKASLLRTQFHVFQPTQLAVFQLEYWGLVRRKSDGRQQTRKAEAAETGLHGMGGCCMLYDMSNKSGGVRRGHQLHEKMPIYTAFDTFILNARIHSARVAPN